MQEIDYVNVIDGVSNGFELVFFFEEALNVTRADGSVILAIESEEIVECETIVEKRAKTCSVCHLSGHLQQRCKKGSCLGAHSCKLQYLPSIQKSITNCRASTKQSNQGIGKGRGDDQKRFRNFQ